MRWVAARRRAGRLALVTGRRAGRLPAFDGRAYSAAAEAAPARRPAASGVTTTPILSVRRVPGWVAETVAAQRLAPALSAILAEPALGPAAAASCLVVSQGGRTLYSANPLESLCPASNMKLLTATAVLDRLGAGPPHDHQRGRRPGRWPAW